MTNFDYYYTDVWKKTIDKVFESGQVEAVNLPYFTSKLINLSEYEAIISTDLFANYSIMNAYKEVIENCLEQVLGKKLKVKIFQADEFTNLPDGGITVGNDFISHNLDQNQTFTSFVVGRSNAQAHLASLTCANNLGMVYNPLFIYGNSGLGKTHLLNAVGNQVKSLFPNKKIGVITGLEFVEGVAKASKEGRLDEFKQSFYCLDLLLVDDIQFIAGKDKTHEIFFTVFNNLINNKKQICITADRIPSEIKGLEERIISRFNQGLTINVDTPEYETSISILKKEIENSNSRVNKFEVDDDVLSYMATNFSQDVRSLLGAVVRLNFYATWKQEDHITLPLAIDAFKDQIKDSVNELTVSTIKKVVCDYYSLTNKQIVSATRTKNIANPRHIAMYLCRKLIDAPYKEIGDEFGGRDHTTVMSACDRVEKLIKTDPLYLKVINEIESKIVK